MKIKIGQIELNLKCVLFGHKISDTTDSGFHYCKRCDAHEYYSYEAMSVGEIDAWAWSIPYKFCRLISRIKNLFTFQRCQDCNKPNYVCGFWVGDHAKCNLPF